MTPFLFLAACAPQAPPAEDLADRWWFAEGAALYIYLETVDPALPGGVVWLRGTYPEGPPQGLHLAEGTLDFGDWWVDDPGEYVIEIAGSTYRGHADDVDAEGCVEVHWLWWSDRACPVLVSW